MFQSLNTDNFENKYGISIFTKDRYWGKAPKEELEKALNLLEESGWDEFKKQYENKFDFTFEENRADWRFQIPVSKNFSVLDIGAGMGRISIPLARVCGKVVAIDQSFLRMKFLKKRAEKENLKNIEVMVANIFELPFEEKSFDLIVMNGVLEWVGMTDKFKNPREAQIKSLKICKKLLKKDGYLYIGIENRYALSYLKATDHSGLRFTSYMPRKIANIYTYLRKSKKYDTYTYNTKGYQKLLNNAGFKNHDFYLVYPGYNLPRIIISYKDLRALSYAIKNLAPDNTWKRKLVKYIAGIKPFLFLYRKLFFSFNIIVKND